MGFTLHKSDEYEIWYNTQPLKSQVQIEKRLSNIEIYGHFGTINGVGNDVWELKWQSGRRVYYAYLEEENILILLGGNKNGQSRDIHDAAKILKDNTEEAEA
ncbi:MAG: putative addiction module killer protein [Chlamydiales bacterium]|jgi:putative addiction module killer protein